MTATRILATRPLTGEVLDHDLPLKDGSVLSELSGPGGIFGKIEPALLHDRADDGLPIVEEWNTSLFRIENDQIVGGGLVTNVSDSGITRNLMAPGFANYPTDMPFLDTWLPDDYQDPVQVYTELWNHLGGFPDGNLNVRVVGEPTYMRLDGGDGPFSIQQTDYADVGQLMDSVLSAARIEWTERHRWADVPGGAIAHEVLLGFPRLGRNQTSTLRLVQGENIVDYDDLTGTAEDYAQDITIVGNGEGYAAIDAGLVQRAVVRDGRLRRAKVIFDPTLMTAAQVAARANAERMARTLGTRLESLTVREHPNAPLNAIGVGDDITLEVDSHHRGRQRLNVRVVSKEQTFAAPHLATLNVLPSATFTYASAANPNPDGEPLLVQV